MFKKFKPARIFYFAGQSSQVFHLKKKNETMRSNYIGCKNILDVIYSFDKSIKFLHAASSEMYGKVSGKISLKTPKHQSTHMERQNSKLLILLNFIEKNLI